VILQFQIELRYDIFRSNFILWVALQALEGFRLLKRRLTWIQMMF